MRRGIASGAVGHLRPRAQRAAARDERAREGGAEPRGDDPGNRAPAERAAPRRASVPEAGEPARRAQVRRGKRWQSRFKSAGTGAASLDFWLGKFWCTSVVGTFLNEDEYHDELATQPQPSPASFVNLHRLLLARLSYLKTFAKYIEFAQCFRVPKDVLVSAAPSNRCVSRSAEKDSSKDMQAFRYERAHILDGLDQLELHVRARSRPQGAVAGRRPSPEARIKYISHINAHH